VMDILLHLDSYPEPTPLGAIDQAVDFASLFEGRLTALALEVLIRPPTNPLANTLINLAGLAAGEQARSAHACKELTLHFQERANARNALAGVVITQADMRSVGDWVAHHAKTRDACIVPVMNELDGQRSVAEAVIFASGRPVIVFRPGHADLPCQGINTVVLAWDNSRTAARAMADALPLLKRAAKVTVLTVTNEKASATPGIGRDVIRHLTLHGVNADIDEIDGGGKSIGATLDVYLERTSCDLLVMGAYGKSRVREFVLGGATAHVLARMKVPLFLAH